MGQLITISIDLKLLDKTRFKKHTKKDGSEALYCEMVLFEPRDTRFGDFIVKQQVTKEERAEKKEMPILGNGKIMGSRNEASNATQQQPSSTGGDEGDTSVPF